MDPQSTSSLISAAREGDNIGTLHDIQAFIDAVRRCSTEQQIALHLEQMRGDLGFDFHALIHHVDHRQADDMMVRIENYPHSWVEVFLSRELFRWDPIHLASRTTGAAFNWTDVPDMISFEACHREVIASAHREGLGEGITVPLHLPLGPSGSCSFAVRAGRVMPTSRLGTAQIIGAFAFEGARKLLRPKAPTQEVRLSSRQLECTVLAGKGKSDAEIARALGIKESTAVEHLEAARSRYGVSRRMQLVLKAINDGTILLSDLLDP